MVLDDEVLSMLYNELDSQINELEKALFGTGNGEEQKKSRKSLNDGAAISFEAPEIKALCGFDLMPTYKNGMGIIADAKNSYLPELSFKVGYRLFLKGALDTGDRECYNGIVYCLENGLGTKKNTGLARKIAKKHGAGLMERAAGFFSHAVKHTRIIATILFVALVSAVVGFDNGLDAFAISSSIQPNIVLACTGILFLCTITSAILKRESWKYITSIGATFICFALARSVGGLDEELSYFLCGIALAVTYALLWLALCRSYEGLFKALLNPLSTFLYITVITLSLLPALLELPVDKPGSLTYNYDIVPLVMAFCLFSWVFCVMIGSVYFFKEGEKICALAAPLGTLSIIISIMDLAFSPRIAVVNKISLLLNIVAAILAISGFIIVYRVHKKYKR